MQATQTAAIQQQERLARRAKQANDRAASLAPKAFVHQVHAPETPRETKHSKQRYFSRGTSSYRLDIASATTDYAALGCVVSAGVFRWADKDTAEISLHISAGHNESSLAAVCSAQELREIAARLLDAAYDIEAFPARAFQEAA